MTVVHPLAAPYLAASLLLVVAGVAKVLSPAPAARALALLGVPVRGPLLVPAVRLLATCEAIIGGAGVVAPGRGVELAVAASYAGFTGFVLLALRPASRLAGCGCFGGPQVPPAPAHAVVTSSLAAASAAVAAGPQPLGAAGPALLVVAVVLTYLLRLTLTALPGLAGASR